MDSQTSIVQDQIELISQQQQQLASALSILTKDNAEWAVPMIRQHCQSIGVQAPSELSGLVYTKVRVSQPCNVAAGLIRLQTDMYYADKPGVRVQEMQLLICQYLQDLQINKILPKKYSYWEWQIQSFKDSRPLIDWFNRAFLKGTEDFPPPLFKLQFAIQDGMVADVFTFSQWQYKGCPVRWTPRRIVWRLRLQMPPVMRDLPHLDLEYLGGLYV